MRIRRAIVIPASLVLGVGGSALAGSAAAAIPVAQASVLSGPTGGQPGLHYHAGPLQPGLHYHT